MTKSPRHKNWVRQRRTAAGWTQAELASRAGISRTAVTAIEAGRLVPSVSVALGLAKVFGCSVETLFGSPATASLAEVWAWGSPESTESVWRAEVRGKTVVYPTNSLPMLTPLPDVTATVPEQTLVMACCDPAAGLLASQFAAITGLRLLVLPRSSGQALELLRQGLVHMAGVHLSTPEQPHFNAERAWQALGADSLLLRVARWQEGIALDPGAKLRSVRSATRAKLTWVGREPGSGARQCLDRLLADRPGPQRFARHHRGVAEAVQSGWADAGICVQLVSAEAGLDFLPVQSEYYDLCIPNSLADDRRIKAFIGVVRSIGYRQLLGQLPGYDVSETGNMTTVSGTN